MTTKPEPGLLAELTERVAALEVDHRATYDLVQQLWRKLRHDEAAPPSPPPGESFSLAEILEAARGMGFGVALDLQAKLKAIAARRPAATVAPVPTPRATAGAVYDPRCCWPYTGESATPAPQVPEGRRIPYPGFDADGMPHDLLCDCPPCCAHHGAKAGVFEPPAPESCGGGTIQLSPVAAPGAGKEPGDSDASVVAPLTGGSNLPTTEQAQGRTCEAWCGGSAPENVTFWNRGQHADYCTEECMDARRPLNPAPVASETTEPARTWTCDLCGETFDTPDGGRPSGPPENFWACAACATAMDERKAAEVRAETWASVEKHAAEVRSWPAWKREGIGLASTGPTEAFARGEPQQPATGGMAKDPNMAGYQGIHDGAKTSPNHDPRCCVGCHHVAHVGRCRHDCRCEMPEPVPQAPVGSLAERIRHEAWRLAMGDASQRRLLAIADAVYFILSSRDARIAAMEREQATWSERMAAVEREREGVADRLASVLVRAEKAEREQDEAMERARVLSK